MVAQLEAKSSQGRDQFLDAIRSFAILRVVTVHMLGLAPIALLWWPAPTFLLPGMPIVFFVAGALSLRALDPAKPRRMSTEDFWRDRFRRLLLPYWGFFAVILAVSWLLDLLNHDESASVDHIRALFSFVPLVHPISSPIAHAGIGHLWFLVCISQLLILAPGLVRVHRVYPVTLLASTGVIFLAMPFLHQYTPVSVRPEMNSLALFAMFFVAGFWYTDGALRKDSAHACGYLLRWPQAIMVAGLFAIAAWLIWRLQAPGSIYDTAWVHGLLGISGLSLILAARPLVIQLAQRIQPALSMLNRRALTIYLWGWPTSLVSALVVGYLGFQGMVGLAMFFGFATLSLLLAVAVFGPLEDRAAGRNRIKAPAVSATAGQSGELQLDDNSQSDTAQGKQGNL